MKTLLIRGGTLQQRRAAARVASQIATQHYGAELSEVDGAHAGFCDGRFHLIAIRAMPNSGRAPSGSDDISLDLDRFPSPTCRALVFALRRAVYHLVINTPGWMLRRAARQQQPIPDEHEQLKGRQRLSHHATQRTQQRRRAA
ncbi:hypothetical protein BI347_22150 [Chromobacterium sphagni]|uniref:Uncharacterized protein n=1 Tax=Chromobacterium sphagni TaxID=1903179 RepID=A0A1S1WTB2_9NEIS|nr:hypothetical protein [Chromobacterium sphagni]OHX10481.1 hypothetical protein BI347_22150 [Chromobacterium sphagni]